MVEEKETYLKALKFLRKNRGLFLKDYEEIDRLKTGIVGLDWLFGNGIPLGRILEIFGMEGAGKTTLAACIAKVFQAKGKRVVYLDYEHSVDLAYFKSIGVEVEDEKLWLFDQPFSLEDGLDGANRLIKTGGVGLLIVDSIAAMVPKAELEGTVVDNNIALQARKFGQALRMMVGGLEVTQTPAIFINQVREAIGTYSYDPYVTPGGRAIKFYASVRIKMSSMKDNRFKLVLKKNKTCALQNASIDLPVSPIGINAKLHFIEWLTKTIIQNRSGSFFMDGEKICRGKEALADFVADNIEELEAKLMDFWSNNPKESWGE